MNKLLLIIPVFFVVLLSSRLTESEPLQSPPVCKNPGDMNPNGSSELSLLMRKMESHAVAARKSVVKKKNPAPFPKEFSKIYTATPTDSTTKHASYNPFADLYMSSLDNLQASATNNLEENYNNLVNACLSCHSQHCPGPVRRIRQLLIEDEK
jgi:hypothetical protein